MARLTAPAVTPRTWSWLFPLPPRGLGQNARAHWSKKQRLTREYREEVVAVVQGSGDRPWEPLEHARLSIEARYCNGRNPRTVVDTATLRAWDRYRPVDRSNVRDACKALQDALCVGPDVRTSAGVLAGDRALQLEDGSTDIVTGVSWAEEGMYVTIEEVVG